MALFGKFSRRDLLKSSAVAALPVGGAAAPALAQPVMGGTQADNLFTRIGVRPLINARGTYTIISGSRSLPEVKQAMFEASHYYVQMDEMMAGIGAELAKLTGAEWGIATNGAESAIVQATIACIAGTNVEKCQALPFIKAKDQVIVPKHSRNPYDVGIRMVGAQIVEVETPQELRAAISARTAMIYVMSDPREAKSALDIASVCTIAKEKGVPVLVDAAAEEPLRPNIHLAKGASLVCYSGGKCLRGPQSSGMLIGDKSLCQAAYFQAAPHHCFGRALKCSKEEAMGLLAAVRQWYARDHDAEQAMWRGWLKTIEARLAGLKSVRFEYLQPADLSNKAPRLRVHWDGLALGVTGSEVVARLDTGTPRILVESGTGNPVIQLQHYNSIECAVQTPGCAPVLTDALPESLPCSLTVMPYMMDPGEERIVADAIHAAMSRPGAAPATRLVKGAIVIAYPWNVTVQYPRGQGSHKLVLSQSDGAVTGTHQGELYYGKVHGTVLDDEIELVSVMEVPGNNITWIFKGGPDGHGGLSGTVDMGEYGPATFSAVHA